MKHLLTAIACCLAVAGSAQFPYNPDADQDNIIGSVDLLSLLPLYGSEFNVPAPEVYQGSSLNTYTQVCSGFEVDTCFIYPFTTDIYLMGSIWIDPVLILLPWENSEFGCHALNIYSTDNTELTEFTATYKINLFYSENYEEWGPEDYSTVAFPIKTWAVHQFVPNPDCTQLYKVGN